MNHLRTQGPKRSPFVRLTHCAVAATTGKAARSTRQPGARAGLHEVEVEGGGQSTLAIALTTASMFLLLSAATQMRPESTP
jgi:hypothetical protein